MDANYNERMTPGYFFLKFGSSSNEIRSSKDIDSSKIHYVQ